MQVDVSEKGMYVTRKPPSRTEVAPRNKRITYSGSSGTREQLWDALCDFYAMRSCIH